MARLNIPEMYSAPPAQSTGPSPLPPHSPGAGSASNLPLVVEEESLSLAWGDSPTHTPLWSWGEPLATAGDHTVTTPAGVWRPWCAAVGLHIPFPAAAGVHLKKITCQSPSWPELV